MISALCCSLESSIFLLRRYTPLFTELNVVNHGWQLGLSHSNIRNTWHTCVSCYSHSISFVSHDVQIIVLKICRYQVDKHLPPLCSGSAYDLTPEIYHLILLLPRIRCYRVPNWFLSSKFTVRKFLFILPFCNSWPPKWEVNCDSIER